MSWAAAPFIRLAIGPKQLNLASDENVRPAGRTLPFAGAVVEPLRFPCDYPACGRSFASKIGLGVHRRAIHPEYADRLINTQNVRERWMDEEQRVMARREAELVILGTRYINVALAQEFPERTPCSIKSHRRLDSYKAMVLEALEQIRNERRPDPPGRRRGRRSLLEAPNEAEEDPFRIFFATLERPEGDADDAFHLQELYQICSDTLTRSKEAIALRVSLYLRRILTPVRPGFLHIKVPQVRRPISKRKERRMQYAKTQLQYNKSRRRCIVDILEQSQDTLQPPREVMEPFWVNVLTRESEGDPRFPEVEELKDFWRPITIEDIEMNMVKRSTAPGPDGLNGKDYWRFPKKVLLCLFNLLLWTERLPKSLLASRTIFIPKAGHEDEPDKYRPITISSILVRGLHRILASRLENAVAIDQRQRGFRSGIDGCRDNVFQLDMILRQQNQSFEPLYMASVDVAKAFPSVSHRALIAALRSFGIPSQFLRYVAYVYENNYTILQGQGWISGEIKPRRGERQGDPLSSPIFNIVTHRLLEALPKEVGVRIGDKIVNASAFADDINLYATTPNGLQSMINILVDFLGQCGMSINVDKSFALGFKPNRKLKVTTMDIRTKFLVGDRSLRTMRRSDEWTYLGVPFTWAGRKRINIRGVLVQDLERLTKAPLKPQQRLFALRTMVLPKVYHQLALGNVLLGALKSADKATRSAVRKWLNLPHDVPNAYFHSPVAEGGLGIPSLRWIAPLMRKGRLESLRNVVNPAAHAFLEKEIAVCKKRLLDQRIIFNSLKDINDWWAAKLHGSVDGGGLSQSAKTSGQHSWVDDGTRFLSGRDFINSCRLRISALPTKSRTSRGRHRDRRCRAGCDTPETLNHVISRCFRTHVKRVQRHDAVAKYVARKFLQNGYQVKLEPHINTEEGLRKPDILAFKNNKVLVVDAQVVGEQFDLRRAHRNKSKYYSENPGILSYIRNELLLPNAGVTFGSVTLNWKGVWSADSASDLKGWGFTQKDLKIISSRVIVGGIAAFRMFNQVTSVRRMPNRVGVG